MDKNTILERAILFATDAHKGQVRDNGEPFILHSIRVMCSVESIEAKIVAILHDVFATDADYCVNEVANYTGFNAKMEISKALSFISRDRFHNVSYEEYILDIKQHSNLARIVKLADLKDNLDMLTYKCSDEKKLKRCIVHCKAYHTLNESN